MENVGKYPRYDELYEYKNLNDRYEYLEKDMPEEAKVKFHTT